MKLRYLLLMLIILSFSSIFIGVKELSPLDLFRLNEDEIQTLYISRIPRLISIVLAGMSLSICGLIMQQLTRNKFVSPTTAGTMDWARLGVIIAIVLFSSAGIVVKILFAFVFALFGSFLFVKILDRIKFKDAIFIPLVGMMLGSVVSAISTFMAYQYNIIQNVNAWFEGNFSLVMKGRYELLFLSIPLVIIAYLFANKFTLAGMGESFSINLGLNYKRVVNIGLIIVSIISSVVILTVGTLPFLGLIIPNIVSIYRGDHLKNSLPHTAVLGAVFVLFCDIAGRLVIYPYEISVGLMVGIIGSGVFLYLLLRRKAYAS
ncbi:ABC transporter permease [Bacillus paralicheniformis]|uniref:Iron-uptake system permease protein FeuB n=1 Tax=Bacillus paralicheniformis TaxID=1648923 RepID=A0ABY3FZT0_9BACI|nr:MULTISPECIES: ABC transporter permease [Bacillus]ETB72357.1 iron ABC transporter permease [Bacillus sp. CPSM8]KJD55881.1 iron ABC transporter permease [Bacillus amyloliquefaciens]KUL14709.1 iron ABC transporter permease [Bacillus licheniformis LMG 7559]AGN34894.1 putative ferrichrome ABC transporter permease protein YclN [Bacillus paralicheniformis ATCC 9945a]AYQ15025.1 ABC transporter permease [Bacillus paralicheniformis]